LEAGSDVYEPLDLGFGRCRLVVARPRGVNGEARSSTLRVATKYPKVAGAHFRERGVSVEVVRLAGSVELAPGLGLSDCIVDVVETGRTLEENGLEQVEEVAASSARLIVNRASYHARREELGRLVDTLGKARA
jgi:ATP phosphoribosyltransferase